MCYSLGDNLLRRLVDCVVVILVLRLRCRSQGMLPRMYIGQWYCSTPGSRGRGHARCCSPTDDDCSDAYVYDNVLFCFNIQCTNIIIMCTL